MRFCLRILDRQSLQGNFTMRRVELIAPSSNRTKAFTLVELLVVVAIVGMLIGLLLPAVQSAREAARRTSCSNHLRQLAIAAHLRHDLHRNFPYGVLRHDALFPHPELNKEGNPPPVRRRYALMHQLLPFLEQNNLWLRWDQFDFAKNSQDSVTGAAWVGDFFMKQTVPTLICPSNPGGPLNVSSDSSLSNRYFRTHYYGCAGTRSYPRFHAFRPSLFNPFCPAVPNSSIMSAASDGLFTRCKAYGIQDTVDGTSSTLLFGERQFYDPVFDLDPDVDDRILDQGWVWFGGEGDVMLSTSVSINFRLPSNFANLSDGVKQFFYDDRINAFGSMHPEGANFAFADGSVKSIDSGISHTVFRALGTRASGELTSD